MKLIAINRKTGMQASEGEAGTIMEAFKPGTGPADSYWVIGMDELAQASPARRSRRRPTRRSARAAAACTDLTRSLIGGPQAVAHFALQAGTPPYVPRRSHSAPSRQDHKTAHARETEKLVDEIKQAISLLRRHL